MAVNSNTKTSASAQQDPPLFNLLRIEEELSAAHLRLCRVYIVNKPYDDIIRRYNRPATFFYIDPPYYNCENDYGKGIFDRSDFSGLASLLSGISGKFIMSINNVRKYGSSSRISTSGKRIQFILPGGPARKKPQNY